MLCIVGVILSCNLLPDFLNDSDQEIINSSQQVEDLVQDDVVETVIPVIEIDSSYDIAFQATGWSVPGADFEIFLMRSDGSGIVPISNHRDRDSFPSWSPDGKQILFASNRDGNYEIYIMDMNGQNQIRLTDNPANDHDPVMSGNGDIVFISNRDGRNHLYIMDGNGKNVRRLTNSNAIETSPSISHSGEKIVFTSNGDDGNYLIISDLSGNTLAAIPGVFMNPSFSPDDQQIAVDSEKFSNVCSFSIHIMNSDGSDLHLLPTHTCQAGNYDKNPVWSPDGEWILYWSMRGEENVANLYKIRVDGTEEIQLTDNEEMPDLYHNPRYPVWFVP